MNLSLQPCGEVKDRWGNVTTIHLLMFGDIPAAVLHSTEKPLRYGDSESVIRQEHVIQGLEYRTPDGKWHHQDVADFSCPTRSRMVVNLPTADAELPDVAQMVRDDYDEEQGFYFAKFGERGAKIPDDASPAFLAGVERAKKQYGRIVRKGVLTGKGMSY